MKAIITILLITIISIKTKSQSTDFIGKSYETVVQNIKVYGLKSDGTKNPDKSFTVRKGIKFTVNRIDAQNNLEISFWPFKGIKNDLAAGYDTLYIDSVGKTHGFINDWADQKSFILELTAFTLGTKIYYGKSNDFTWGVMTLPIKARIGNKKDRFFDFEENLNLGFTAGLKHQITGSHQQWLNYLAGVSVARVRTDSISLKNKFPTPESKVSSGLMFSLGMLYQYETFQVGVFTGVDVIPGELGRNWKHQGRPWIGFALGVSLFTKTNPGSDSGKNRN